MWSQNRLEKFPQMNNNNAPIERLTVAEEDLVLDVLIHVYPPEANKAWQFSTRVWQVAIAFLRRFFLDRSVMDYDVKQCLNTCVVLASKVEEERKNNNRTLQFMQREMPSALDVNLILELEYVILDALQFQLEIYTPLPALTGFCLDLQAKLGAYELDLEQLARIKVLAEELVKKAVLTEAILLFPPSQIALAALRVAIVVQEEAEEIWNKYAVVTFGSNPNWLELTRNMQQIEQQYFTFTVTPEHRENIKLINAKLRKIPKLPLK